MREYLDSDVLIWHLRGHAGARALLKSLRTDANRMLCLGALQRAEIVFFARAEELHSTLLLLSLFETVPVDAGVVDLGGELYRAWHPSHGIDVADALLAATVMKTGGRIHTLNRKHFPMPDLLVQQAW
jgi:predicted nucleic acid-binding protein